MKRLQSQLAAVLTAGACLWTSISIPASAADNTSLTDTQLAQYAQEVMIQLNRERAAYGLAPLYTTTALQQAAAARAAECAESFSHTRPDGSDCFSVLEEYQISYTCCGENIAYGYTTSSHVVRAWMNSDRHRANILGEDLEYAYVGVGVAESDGVLYWATDFTGGVVETDAQIPTEQGVTGDADYDGSVTTNDAYLTLRAYSIQAAGGELPMQTAQVENCDVDEDGAITSEDAFRILRYYSDHAAGGTISWDELG